MRIQQGRSKADKLVSKDTSSLSTYGMHLICFRVVRLQQSFYPFSWQLISHILNIYRNRVLRTHCLNACKSIYGIAVWIHVFQHVLVRFLSRNSHSFLHTLLKSVASACSQMRFFFNLKGMAHYLQHIVTMSCSWPSNSISLHFSANPFSCVLLVAQL